MNNHWRWLTLELLLKNNSLTQASSVKLLSGTLSTPPASGTITLPVKPLSSDCEFGAPVWGVTDRGPNAEWIYAVDADGFFELLTERLSRL